MAEPYKAQEYPPTAQAQYPMQPYPAQAAPGYYPPQAGYPTAVYPGQPGANIQYLQGPQQGGAIVYSGQPAAGQVVFVTAPAVSVHHSAMKSFGEKIKTGYGIFRLLQLLSACALLGLICALLSFDYGYWYYWLWLLIMPLSSISTALTQLFRKANITWAYGGGGDIAYAIFYAFQAGAIGAIYYFGLGLLYYNYWNFFYWNNWDDVADAAMGMCGLLSFLNFITGCSALCCHCLGRP